MRRALAASLAALALALGLAVPGCGPVEPASPFGASIDAPLRLWVEASRREVALFGELELTWDLAEGRELAAGAEDFVPPVPEGFVGEEVARVATPVGDHVWTHVVQRLRPVGLGTLEIPSVSVERGTARASTDPVGITVVSRLEGELPEGVAVDALEEPAAAFGRSDTVGWIVLAVVLAAVGALALFSHLAFRRGPGRTPASVALPAHVEALRALARLRNAPRGTDAEIDAFYVAVSDVLRRYLERRFGLHAPERTTEEFLPEVASSGRLDAGQQAHLRDFLSLCDLVKFARHRPGEEDHARAFDFAESFVHATRADRPAPSPPAAEEVA